MNETPRVPAPEMLPALEPFFNAVRSVILFLSYVSGAAIFGMIGVTVTDIVLRLFKSGVTGAYDIVCTAGAVSLACALPYVTAVKGHIAIEFCYRKAGRLGRIIMDSLFRLILLVLFALLVYRNIGYGIYLFSTGQVMLTLRTPIFWLPFLLSASFALVLVVTFYHLLHPGKGMIKP
ncbi:MAG: TRAP transporter small permease subunit [Spirochaetales bacterium]|jgi:TRAP-type C4-dicarboxylate transport system permease small subunit|nr:TRAP transporter small permease subunit [Spirochaetales bacterium]